MYENTPATTVLTDDKPEDLSDEELFLSIAYLKKTNKILQLENQVFESYLYSIDPDILSGIQEMIMDQTSASSAHTRLHSLSSNASNRRSSFISLASRQGTDDSTTSSKTSRIRSGSLFKSSPTSEPVSRISVAQKEEIVSREMDKLYGMIQKNRKKSAKLEALLKWKLKAAHLQTQDIWDTNEKLNVLLKQNSRKFLAENYLRFIEDCQKSMNHQMDKLQFRIKNLEQSYRHVCHQLMLKQHMEDNVILSDYKQLLVEKKLCILKSEERKNQILEMRNNAGRKVSQMTYEKDKLMQQEVSLLKTEEEIQLKHTLLTSLQEESKSLELQVKYLEERFSAIVFMKKSYKVPDIMDYLKKKVEIQHLHKAINIWQQRRRVQRGKHILT